MDFIGGLREQTLGEVASTLATEGLGVGVGFIGAGTVGRRIEDWLLGTTVIAPTSSMTDKVKGWAYNNVPKALIWYLLRHYVEVTPGETLTASKEIAVDAKKAIAGSIAFDTLLRLVNSGVPVHDPSSYKLLGGKGIEVDRALAPAPAQADLQTDIQKLIQENSALRAELNKALQRLASTPAQVPMAPTPPVVRYQPVQAQTQPVIPVSAPVRQVVEMPAYYPEIRERKYGFMEGPPGIAERERRYGFATNEGEIASMFGMR